MKNKTIRTAIMSLAVAMLMSVAACASTFTIATLSGEVNVRSKAGGSWEKAKAGQKLTQSASVRTGKGASAVLKSSAGSIVKVSAMTQMDIAELSTDAKGSETAKLSLNGGKLSASVKKVSGKTSSFNIKTPTAVAGVRGTDFYAEVNDNGASTFGVTEGEIEVTSGDIDTILSQDFTVTVEENGTVSEPEPIPEEIKEQLVEEQKEMKQDAETVIIEEQQGESAAPESGEEADDADVATEAADNVSDTLDQTINDEIVGDAIDAGEEAMKTGSVTIDIQIGQQ